MINSVIPTYEYPPWNANEFCDYIQLGYGLCFTMPLTIRSYDGKFILRITTLACGERRMGGF